MKYWLMKSEPETFSINDLKDMPKQTDHWDGIRNYAARLHIRNMAVGDLAFFYHSQVNPPAIVGVVKIVRGAYTDHTQFDTSEKYYDAKSDPDNPKWDMVDVQYHQDNSPPLWINSAGIIHAPAPNCCRSMEIQEERGRSRHAGKSC